MTTTTATAAPTRAKQANEQGVEVPVLWAVSYLRVSTREQAERGGTEEGFSIPAQREANQRKAAELGARVVREFVDAGESARSADRDGLKDMLGMWVENKMLLSCSAMYARSTCMTSSRVSGSSPLVGSSSTASSGRGESASSRASLFPSPLESSFTRADGSSRNWCSRCSA